MISESSSHAPFSSDGRVSLPSANCPSTSSVSDTYALATAASCGEVQSVKSLLSPTAKEFRSSTSVGVPARNILGISSQPSVSCSGRAAADNSRFRDNYAPGSAFGRSSSRSQEKLTKCSSGSSSAYSGSKRDAQFFSSLHSEFPRRNGRGRVRAHVSLLVAGIFPCVFPKVVILVDRCLSPPLVCATPPWMFLRLLMLE